MVVLNVERLVKTKARLYQLLLKFGVESTRCILESRISRSQSREEEVEIYDYKENTKVGKDPPLNKIHVEILANLLNLKSFGGLNGKLKS